MLFEKMAKNVNKKEKELKIKVYHYCNSVFGNTIGLSEKRLQFCCTRFYLASTQTGYIKTDF